MVLSRKELKESRCNKKFVLLKDLVSAVMCITVKIYMTIRLSLNLNNGDHRIR
jgi:hypothetical protein